MWFWRSLHRSGAPDREAPEECDLLYGAMYFAGEASWPITQGYRVVPVRGSGKFFFFLFGFFGFSPPLNISSEVYLSCDILCSNIVIAEYIATIVRISYRIFCEMRPWAIPSLLRAALFRHQYRPYDQLSLLCGVCVVTRTAVIIQAMLFVRCEEAYPSF